MSNSDGLALARDSIQAGWYWLDVVVAMTYNVGNGLAYPDRLINLIRAAHADIVGLQELALPQAEVLAKVADVYPHQVLQPAGFAGKGLLSRYPIQSSEVLRLYPDRPDLRAWIDIDGVLVHVLVAHPPPPRLQGPRMVFDPNTLFQLEQLRGLALEHSPGLLMGDFNMTPRNPAYARYIGAGLVDAFASAGAGRGLTLPRRVGQTPRFRHGLHRVPLRPIARVDYIWCTPGVKAEAAWVGDDAGSDHLPVLARVTFDAA
jgi:vancomycin resistance protein VanJ